MRQVLTWILVLAACAEVPGQSRSVKELFEASPEQESSPAAVKNGPPASAVRGIAEVNNQKIDSDEFFEVLYASAGSRVLRQFIGLTLARQMARAEGIDPSQADFDLEYYRVRDQLSPEKDATGKKLTTEDKERILSAILARRGLSREEFKIGLKHQVYLKVIVKKKIKITDQALRDEFARVYGEKRKIRSIMVADLPLATDIYNQLQKGKDFAALAGKYSIDFISAPIGGQVGEVTKSDPRFPAVVSETAFKLKVEAFSSPIRVNNQYWIIKVDQELAPEPISFDKVREQLHAQLYLRQETEMIQKLEAELFKQAKIKVYDKLLSQEYDKWLRQIEVNE